MSTYQITAQGTTYAGSTSFFNANTTFTPLENFSLPGFLVMTPSAIDPAGLSGNGVNAADIGILLGTPFDLDVRAGELIWASNNALHDAFASTRTGAASIDEVTQSFDPNTNTLVSVLDPNVAPQTNLDFYVEHSGLLGFPRQITGGEVDLFFSPDFTTVHGAVTFYGGGFVEPGTFAQTIQFDGVFIGA